MFTNLNQELNILIIILRGASIRKSRKDVKGLVLESFSEINFPIQIKGNVINSIVEVIPSSFAVFIASSSAIPRIRKEKKETADIKRKNKVMLKILNFNTISPQITKATIAIVKTK